MTGDLVMKEQGTMDGNDSGEMSVPTNRAAQAPDTTGNSLHGDMSPAGSASSDRNDRAQAASVGTEADADGDSGLTAPDDDTLGTLTTGGTGGTTGVSGTAEATFEGAGHSYGDPDTVRDDRPGQ